MEAYLIGMAASVWGDIPYSQVLNESIDNPWLDEQDSVYASVQVLLDSAIQNFESDTTLIPQNDMFFNGVPTYYKFTNEGAYEFFANLFNKVPEIQVILYSFEKLFGYKFDVPIIERLVKEFPQVKGVKDSDYDKFDTLKIDDDFLIFPGSETKLLRGLELGNAGIISATVNITASLARKVYDDFYNKKKQTFNERLCAIRKIFDKNNLISGLHTFMSFKDKKYKTVLPPLSLLSKEQEKQMMDALKALNFYPEKNIAA